MNPIDCIPEDALADVLALPADDPRRAHLDACPRCRALLAGYEAFLSPGERAAAAYGPAEQRSLDAARARLLGVPSAAAPASPPAQRRAGPTGTADPAAPWWTALFAPRLRPAWALVAFAVIATVVVMLPRDGGRDETPRVRGFSDRPLALAEPTMDAAGGTMLSWRAAAGADRYEVRLFSAALEPIGRFDAGSDTTLSLTAEQLPAAFGRGEPVLVRVVAFQAGDELATSGAVSLRKR